MCSTGIARSLDDLVQRRLNTLTRPAALLYSHFVAKM